MNAGIRISITSKTKMKKEHKGKNTTKEKDEEKRMLNMKYETERNLFRNSSARASILTMVAIRYLSR